MNYCFHLLFLISCATCLAQPSPDATIKIRSTPDFEIKADTNYLSWKAASWVALTHRGGTKQYNTKFKVLYSETGFYTLFYCADKLITSTLKADFTDLYKEDVVEAFFWTDESAKIYFEYELSPYNYELPIMVPNTNGTFLGWLPWHYDGARKTRRDAAIGPDHSWTAAFFIPYALLKPLGQVPPKKGTKWRCNFYRMDYDEGNSKWSWQPTDGSFHDFERFGTVLFD